MERSGSNLASVSDRGAAGETASFEHPHRWIIEPVGLTPAGKCSICGIERVFTNEPYAKASDGQVPNRVRGMIMQDWKARLFVAKGLTHSSGGD